MESSTPLKEWRIAQKLTPQQAAERVGVSLPTWSRWENDRRRVPAERVADISAVTGIPSAGLRPDVFREVAA